MNVFFGLPIPLAEIHLFKNMLIKEHPQWENHSAIRWTTENNHHLTLHFFGPIDPNQLSELRADLDNYLRSVYVFTIKINKLHNFPKEKSDLVAAYVQLSAPLAKLYRQLEMAVKDHQFPVEERAFSPHITLCRAKRRRVLTMDPIYLPDYPIPIHRLVLYQSQSTPEGSQYRAIQEWPFE